MAKVLIDEATLTGIADIIREKDGTTNLIPVVSMRDRAGRLYNKGVEEGIQQGNQEAYEEIQGLNEELEQTLYGTDTGGKSYYDILWDNLQSNGKRMHYVNAFSYTGWNDKNYNPKYPITPKHQEGIGSMFVWNVDIVDTKVPITAHGKCQQAFYQCANLKRIPKLIFDGATTINNMFYNCSNLEELYCEGTLDITGLNLKDSPKLNKASIESVISILSTTTTGLSITLSQTAVNNAFTTDEWNALIGTRTNWTISLV